MNRGRRTDLADHTRLDSGVADAFDEVPDDVRRELVDRRLAHSGRVRGLNVQTRAADDVEPRGASDPGAPDGVSADALEGQLHHGLPPRTREELELFGLKLDVV